MPAASPATVARPAPTRAPTWALKVVMAVTGLLWLAFVLVHLVGNLKVYAGPESFNSYAAWLREVLHPLVPHEGVLWALRVVLALALVGHIWAAAVLTARARRARGGHRARLTSLRSFTARTMPVTGIVVLGFLGFHLLDLTLGVEPVASSGFTPAEGGVIQAYGNLVASFERPWASAAYVISMLVLAAHVLHGTITAASDLGATNRTVRSVATWVGGLAAVAIVLGNAMIPVAVLAGVVS